MLIRSMKQINKIGAGVIVILRSVQKDLVSSSIESKIAQDPAPKEIRDYGIGAQILSDLGINKMQLLTNNPKSVIGLDGYDIQITKFLEVK